MAYGRGPPLSAGPGDDVAWRAREREMYVPPPSASLIAEMNRGSQQYGGNLQPGLGNYAQSQAALQQLAQQAVYQGLGQPVDMGFLRSVAAVAPPVEAVAEPEPTAPSGHRELDLEPAREVAMPKIAVRNIEL